MADGDPAGDRPDRRRVWLRTAALVTLVRAVVGGELSAKGDLNDMRTWADSGPVGLAEARLWRIPAIGVILRGATKLAVGHDEPGCARATFVLDRTVASSRDAQLLGPSAAILIPRGQVDLAGRVDMDVMVAPRVVPGHKVRLPGKIVAWTDEHLLNHLIKLELTGTLDEPEAKVVPLAIISEVTGAFFKEVLRRGK
jgi:hypothetical protein